ncbi:MAG TPA: hypothetical protein VJX94_06485 [Stellaceae bacterium]|nr:hypothetical protein [Stellaceae bacterium]
MSERQQQLPSTFTEHADLLAELPGNFDNVLPDIVLTGNALVVFIPSLDHQRWNNGQDDEQKQSAHQTYTNAARDDKSMRALHLRPVHPSAHQWSNHR